MPDILSGILILYMLCCTAFNVSWWLYGKTLSEFYPVSVVVIIMLTTMSCFYFGFNYLFDAILGFILPSDFGYVSNFKFIPLSKEIAKVFAGICTIGMAILLYKDEGKIYSGKYEGNRDV